jgi:hypothetical protein
LGSLSHLVWIEIGGNLFSGSIPPELGNLTSLVGLSLAGNPLGGSIPPQLGNLSQLQTLYLFDNQLSGSIPPELGNLTNLVELRLGGNQLSGSMPSQLASLTSLRELDLGNNLLSGSLPAQLGNLAALQRLNLSNNLLTGILPAELGNLTQLQECNLNNNQLSGALPESLTNLVTLAVFPDYTGLDLGFNRLTVPAAPQALADFLAEKDPDWYLTQAVSNQVTPTGGGAVSSNDGSTDLLFPPGSAPATITVTYVPQDSPDQAIPGNVAPANLTFGLEVLETKAAFTFAQPATVTITYSDGALQNRYDQGGGPFNIPEDTLRLYFWDDSAAQWIDAAQTCAVPAAYTRNLAANSLSLHICQAGAFTLLGEREFPIFLPVIQR